MEDDALGVLGAEALGEGAVAVADAPDVPSAAAVADAAAGAAVQRGGSWTRGKHGVFKARSFSLRNNLHFGHIEQYAFTRKHSFLINLNAFP